MHQKINASASHGILSCFARLNECRQFQNWTSYLRVMGNYSLILISKMMVLRNLALRNIKALNIEHILFKYLWSTHFWHVEQRHKFYICAEKKKKGKEKLAQRQADTQKKPFLQQQVKQPKKKIYIRRKPDSNIRRVVLQDSIFAAYTIGNHTMPSHIF